MINSNPTKELLGGRMYESINQNILEYHEIFYGGKAMNTPTYLSTGNEVLDHELQGGYRKGTLTEICGPSNAGKTLLALKAIKEVQKEDKLAIYIDADRKFRLDYLEEHGIDEEGIILIQPQSIEQLAVMLSEIVKPNVEDIGVIIIDSLADLSTKKEQGSKICTNTDIHRSKVIKALLMRIANLVRNSEACAIILNQLRNSFKEDGTVEVISTSERWVKMTCDTRLRLTLDEDGDPCVDVTFKDK